VNPPAWRRWVLPFIVGLLVGLAVGVHLWRCNPFRGHHEPKPGRLVEKFSRQLGLSPEQKEKLAAILEKGHGRMKDLHEKTAPHFEAIQKDTAIAIEKILTPEQLEKFRKIERKCLLPRNAKGQKRCPPPGEPGQ